MKLPLIAKKLHLDKAYERIQPKLNVAYQQLQPKLQNAYEFSKPHITFLRDKTMDTVKHLDGQYHLSEKLHLRELADRFQWSDLKRNTKVIAREYFSAYCNSLSRFVDAIQALPTARKFEWGFILFFNGLLPLFFWDTAEAHMVTLSLCLSTILMHLLYELTQGLSPITDAAHFVWLPVLLNLWATGGLEVATTSGVTHTANVVLKRAYWYALWIRALLVVNSICLTLDVQRLTHWWKERNGMISAGDRPLLVVPESVLREAQASGETLSLEIKKRKLDDTITSASPRQTSSLLKDSKQDTSKSFESQMSLDTFQKDKSSKDFSSEPTSTSSTSSFALPDIKESSGENKALFKEDYDTFSKKFDEQLGFERSSIPMLPEGEGTSKQVLSKKAPPITIMESDFGTDMSNKYDPTWKSLEDEGKPFAAKESHDCHESSGAFKKKNL